MDTIERATLEDLPQLVELLEILFRRECDFEPNPDKQEKGLRLLLNSPSTGCIFVYRRAAKVVGMLSLLFTISTARGGRVCWLEDMVVHPHQQHLGIGSRLLGHAIEFAKREGILRITLLTDRCNDAAQRFYERHGFQTSQMMTLRRVLVC